VAKHAQDSAKLAAVAAIHVTEVAQKAEETALLLDESNQRVRARDKITMEKLEEVSERTRKIEASTDGAYTAMLRNQLLTLKAYKLSEERFVNDKIETGRNPTAETLGVLAAIQNNITALEQELSDRSEALTAVKDQIKLDKVANSTGQVPITK
jgi:hypothetical protein